MLAERIGVSASTASESIRKLADQGLVDHEKYGAVTLTERGSPSRDLAVVRRHRLLETFLVSELGYSWDEVHDEAEVLEHAVSDLMMARIDAKLGHPQRDPHGDPIPDWTDRFRRRRPSGCAECSRRRPWHRRPHQRCRPGNAALLRSGGHRLDSHVTGAGQARFRGHGIGLGGRQPRRRLRRRPYGRVGQSRGPVDLHRALRLSAAAFARVERAVVARFRHFFRRQCTVGGPIKASPGGSPPPAWSAHRNPPAARSPDRRGRPRRRRRRCRPATVPCRGWSPRRRPR